MPTSHVFAGRPSGTIVFRVSRLVPVHPNLAGCSGTGGRPQISLQICHVAVHAFYFLFVWMGAFKSCIKNQECFLQVPSQVLEMLVRLTPEQFLVGFCRSAHTPPPWCLGRCRSPYLGRRGSSTLVSCSRLPLVLDRQDSHALMTCLRLRGGNLEDPGLRQSTARDQGRRTGLPNKDLRHRPRHQGGEYALTTKPTRNCSGS